MRENEWFYGTADASDEERRGALKMSEELAGIEMRRLARKYRIHPDCDRGPELIDRLDNPLLRARYISRRGIGIDEFANLMSETVTLGRPSLDRAVELLEWALRGRRATRAEKLARAAEELETRNVARELVENQTRAVIEFQNRTRRGSKLVAWKCECTRGAALWASFAVNVNATCNVCAAVYARKSAIPTMDEAAIVAASEPDEPTPF